MRKTTMVALFACALIPLMSVSSADALSLDFISTTEIKEGSIEKSVLDMLSPEEEEDMEAAKPKVVKEDVEVRPSVVEHVVKGGDSLESIAKKYDVSWKRIYSKNTNIDNPDVIAKGLTLVIPDAEETLKERALPEPAPVVAKAAPVAYVQAPASSAGNLYTYGYCTWYVANKRPDMPNNLGDARTWVARAAAQGYTTGSVPIAGAIGALNNHVVYVERINSDGTVLISEMNRAGWNVKSTRTVPASTFNYIY
jgi:surface antigen